MELITFLVRQRIATLTMAFKLRLAAQKHWRRLQGSELFPKGGYWRSIRRRRRTRRTNPTSCLANYFNKDAHDPPIHNF